MASVPATETSPETAHPSGDDQVIDALGGFPEGDPAAEGGEVAEGQAAAGEGAEPTSATEPAPASSPFDLSDPDVRFMVEKYGNDPNKIARELHALNNRTAEEARQRKVVESVRQPQTQARAAAPPQGALPKDLEAQAAEDIQRDQECASYVADYVRAGNRIAEIATFDRAGNIVAGQAFDTDSEIRAKSYTVNQLTQALKTGKDEVGLELDEFRRGLIKERLSDLKSELADLKETRKGLVDDYARAKDVRQQTAEAYDRRSGAIKARYATRYDEVRREETAEQEIQQDAAKFLKDEWTPGLKAAMDAVGIPADPAYRQKLGKRIQREIGMEVHSTGVPIPEGGVKEAIEKRLNEFLEDSGFIHRQKLGKLATAKTADATSPAPRGKAAVAPADPADDPNAWKEKFNATKRELGLL